MSLFLYSGHTALCVSVVCVMFCYFTLVIYNELSVCHGVEYTKTMLTRCVLSTYFDADVFLFYTCHPSVTIRLS